MLCQRCQPISFQPFDGGTGRGRRPGSSSELIYILHHDRASFAQSVTAGCQLCTMIEARMTRTSSPSLPPAYRSLQAYVVLKCSIGNRTVDLPGSVTVISLRGTFVLEVIGQSGNTIPDEDDTSTGSTANLSLAKSWMETCLHTHPLCTNVIAQQQTHFHPRRLINLSDPDKPFIQITTPDSSPPPYIALSYAWGEGYRFVTIKSNLAQHQTSLPVPKLPRTFRDALRVASHLGASHIWIDALCIIQDDPQDLDAELPIMGDIYRHAVLTIYAEGSSSTQSGLFRGRDALAHRPCTVAVTGLSLLPPSPTTVALATTAAAGPDHLKSRSWCLQEEVLTSRFLRFGARQASWRCLTSSASETRPVPQPVKTSALTDVLASDIDRLRMWLYAPVEMSTSPPARQKWFRADQYDAWYAVVQEYSARQLRAAGDNLKALSGLAAMFARTHDGSRYLAGLWAEDLAVGLGWYVALNDARAVVGVDGAPSWSWTRVGKVRVRFRGWEAHAVSVEEEGVRLLEAGCGMVDFVNPYGAVRWGPLKVRGRVWMGRVVYDGKYAEYRTRAVPRPGQRRVEGFEGEDKKEHPRFPALILGLSSLTPVAEAALDFVPAKDPLLETGVAATCLLLHDIRASGSGGL
ncbi:heterokaryon incompatibility protein-domain-containing protein [Coniochaeta sp. 2T2.1]|nr:heterokaryon incompatibility protein-domain-containing protein [Coniochaeta sp. 2T2.1]